ncbi:alpha/beta fold hydrolase [Deinococcus murrayi]|uniref:alpha/beta fold hydrolase n=1 Tax=Deinococcus murrayi TaxID=68910 RepID=UPI00047FF2B7|nr:alpha/beta hydrolase [Deinococcus murrayi]
MPPTDPAPRSRHVVTNGVRLHVVETGPEDGPPILLLHGFPEYWEAWTRQLGPLARAGFRVFAPDLRGYNLSEKPLGTDAYRVSLLQADVAGLIRALGYERAHVVGHDWGGIIAWALALRQPQVIERLVILNAPHPAAYRRALRTPAQWGRSWYVLYFQLPWLPERTLRRFGRWALRGANPQAYLPAERRRYEEAWARPGAATAMLNYYRAMTLRGSGGSVPPLRVPTLVLWGERDAALLPELAQGLEEWVPGVRVVRFARASHWVMRDETIRVNNHLMEFLSGR